MANHPLLIMPLKTRALSLAHFGGKARGLAALACAGLPVPEGFFIATSAYRDFVRHNGLRAAILELALAVQPGRAESAEAASIAIKQLFSAGQFPDYVSRAIAESYQDFTGEAAVAVRSSATAEDLPGLSFAGQQESYLNVRGVDSVMSAVRDCWASLWSARAIAYRQRMVVDSDSLSMGVVVQMMLESEISGVAFSANPVSGDRSELVINSSYGLGEAIVSGLVTPDSYLLDRESLAVSAATPGEKSQQIVYSEGQGVETQPLLMEQRDELSLSPDQLSGLAELVLQAEGVFNGIPQDIEWALVADKFWLLQSRPITNLPAQPLADVVWQPPEAGAKLMRRQVVENMPEPLSPLFEDLYLHKGLDAGMDRLVSILEMPFKLDDLISRPMFVAVNGYGYSRYDFRFSWSLLLLLPKILVWYVRSLPKLLKNLVPLWEQTGLPEYLGEIERYRLTNAAELSEAELLTGVRTLASADAIYWFYITLMVGAAKVSEGLFAWFVSSRLVKGDLTSGMFLGGFASKTLEAQEDLEAIASQLSSHDRLRDLALACAADDLLDRLRLEPEAQMLVSAIDSHLQTFGHQVYNLDFAAPTQAEQPAPVLLSLQSMLRYGQPVRQIGRENLAADRDALTQTTRNSLGPVRRWIFKHLLGWAQRFGPYREQALFYMGAAWPTLRRLSLALGQRQVAAGRFSRAEDVFYLSGDELEELCSADTRHADPAEIQARIEERRNLRQMRKHLHPPARVPQDLRFKFGWLDLTRYFEVWETQKHNSDTGSRLKGFAVSPGQVTAPAVVISSVADFALMRPGSILVCATTTPAWTPLFSQAVGLVTDIGGILAHGSIVAREYGIPAVLGTGNATARIVTGQVLTLDGTAGTVTLMSDSPTRE
jgi:pyruvate,water dikinase